MRLHHVLFSLLILGLASLAYGLNYMYFSDEEMTVFGDRIKFMSGDTLVGPIRTNGCFSIMGAPVFFDWVITGCEQFSGPIEPPPPILPDSVIFEAPALPLTAEAAWVRQQALQQGFWFSGGDSLRARVRLGDHTLRLWWTAIGTPPDTSDYTDYPLPDTATVFFDCDELHLSGVMNSVLVLGARGRIGLEDNVLYASANPTNGVAPSGHPEKLAVISEGEIKILNTVANGRENGGGQGYNAPHSRGSIVLDGIYVALNESFTFEQQNDLDSGYVYCAPPNVDRRDERGTVYLYGGLIQKRRGYVHRSSCGSTGYLKNYRYDPDLKFWDLHLFDARENLLAPAQIDFGAVAVGDTARDTVTVYNDFIPVEMVLAANQPPFHLTVLEDTLPFQEQILVQFIPVAPGEHEAAPTLNVPYYNQTLTLPLHGTATALAANDPPFILHPSSFILSASPNPFNSRTGLTLALPETGRVRLDLYSVDGRRVAVLHDGFLAAGSHTIPLNGEALASGIYLIFAHTDSHQAALKLALIK